MNVICIWDVVIVFIVSNVFIIKSKRDRFLCGITCRWCMRSWILKTGFLGVGVDNSERLFLLKQSISLPMVQNSTNNQKYYKKE